jgi:hypothetical protein
MASFTVSLLVGDDTMRARGHANIKGKPVSTDPSTPLLVKKVLPIELSLLKHYS